MEEESDKRAGGRQARQRACIDRPGDQREKPEKGRRLWRDTVCPSAAAGYSVSHQQPPGLLSTYPQFCHGDQGFLPKTADLITY